jgi:hypothetical protein
MDTPRLVVAPLDRFRRTAKATRGLPPDYPCSGHPAGLPIADRLADNRTTTIQLLSQAVSPTVEDMWMPVHPPTRGVARDDSQHATHSKP